WPPRAPDIHHPDQLVFDLDPASGDLGVIRAAAAGLRELLEELGLAAFLKSSGSRGLPGGGPVIPAADTDPVKLFSIAAAEALAARHPDDFTTESRIANRHGRLYPDIGRDRY